MNQLKRQLTKATRPFLRHIFFLSRRELSYLHNTQWVFIETQCSKSINARMKKYRQTIRDFNSFCLPFKPFLQRLLYYFEARLLLPYFHSFHSSSFQRTTPLFRLSFLYRHNRPCSQFFLFPYPFVHHISHPQSLTPLFSLFLLYFLIFFLTYKKQWRAWFYFLFISTQGIPQMVTTRPRSTVTVKLRSACNIRVESDQSESISLSPLLLLLVPFSHKLYGKRKKEIVR